jgi:predicted phage tail protein
MKTIILLGELGKRYGRKHLLDVKSPAEAVRALCANFRDFAGFVSSSQERNVGYRVINVRNDVGIDELHNPAGRTITIAPVIAGAGGGNPLTNILVGAALIAAATFNPFAFLGGTALLTGLAGQVAFGVGVSLVIGGASQLLSPQPDAPNPYEDTPTSYIFNGAVNTTSQGQPVPIGYGRMLVGSAVISAGIIAEDIA